MKGVQKHRLSIAEEASDWRYLCFLPLRWAMFRSLGFLVPIRRRWTTAPRCGGVPRCPAQGHWQDELRQFLDEVGKMSGRVGSHSLL